MNIKCFIILMIFIFVPDICAANEYIDSLWYNGLQISKEHIDLFDYLKDGKEYYYKSLNRAQRRKYRLVKHLIKHDKHKKEKDFFRLNPRLTRFGNISETK